jgi:hypothetical protein
VEQKIAQHWMNGFNIKLRADGLATSLMEEARNAGRFREIFDFVFCLNASYILIFCKEPTKLSTILTDLAGSW